MSNGFLASNATPNIQIIRPKFGQLPKTIQLRCCAAVADINYQLPNTSNVIQLAQIADADLIRNAPAIMIFTLKPGFENIQSLTAPLAS